MKAFTRHLAMVPLCFAASLTLAACEVVPQGSVDDEQTAAVDPFADQPDFFPLGVYLQSAQRAEQWSEVGINMIVRVNGFTTKDDVERFNSLGMHMIGNDRDRLPLEQLGAAVPLYVGKDEPDNAQRQLDGSYGPCRTPEELAEESAFLRELGQGRPVFRNFGRGIVNPDWKGRGECAGMAADYYPEAIASADVVAFDYYPVMESEPLSQVANGARNLAGYIAEAGGKQGQWGIIEASAIRGGVVPSPEQIRSMAWMQIINGARGLVFFPWEVNEKGARIREDASFANAETVAGLKRLTQEITALSPAIKSDRLAEFTKQTSLEISAMARQHDGAVHLFAVSEAAGEGEVTFTLPEVSAQSVEVLGENRVIAMTNNSFTDQFAPYEAHVYRISNAGSATEQTT